MYRKNDLCVQILEPVKCKKVGYLTDFACVACARHCFLLARDVVSCILFFRFTERWFLFFVLLGTTEQIITRDEV